MNDEANEADEIINEATKKMAVKSMANGEAETSDTMQEGVGIEVDDIEKGMRKEKIDAGKRKSVKYVKDCKLLHVSAKRVMRKQKLAALVEKLNKMKDAKQVVRKGKLAKLVKNSKKKAEKDESQLVKKQTPPRVA
nr:hypothetical protein [Tanacetum cinerariifolium]